MMGDLVKELRQYLHALVTWQKATHDILREIRMLLEDIKQQGKR